MKRLFLGSFCTSFTISPLRLFGGVGFRLISAEERLFGVFLCPIVRWCWVMRRRAVACGKSKRYSAQREGLTDGLQYRPAY